MLSVPRVAMMGGTLPSVMISPLKLPRMPPSTTPSITSSTTGVKGKARTTNETSIATRARVEATDRSMPRVMMIMPCASAIIARMEMSSRILLRLAKPIKLARRAVTRAARRTIKATRANSRRAARRAKRLDLVTAGLVVVMARPLGKAGSYGLRGGQHDLFLSGLGPAELAGYAPLVHHENPVAHAQHLRQL